MDSNGKKEIPYNCSVARVTYHDGFAKTSSNMMQADKSRTIGHYVVGKKLLHF